MASSHGEIKHWTDDKQWADRFMPEIKQILGLYLIGEATRDDDALRCTDLIVLKMDSVRIAVRMRKNKYLKEYGDEFTIRKSRPSKNESELSKIISGWGDYFFYGFCDEEETRIVRWKLIDLRKFRKWFSVQLWRLPERTMPGDIKNNNDNSSDFVAFNQYDLGDGVIIAEHNNDKGGAN